MSRIAILGTLDTKGEEVLFMKELVRSRGHLPTVLDVGPLGPSAQDPDVSNEKIARLAGYRLRDLRANPERHQIMKAMGEGAARWLLDCFKKGDLGGVIGVGGNQGTAISSTAMRVLPIGFPKFMVSTVASGNIRPYIGNKDIGFLFSVADFIGGPNPVSRSILTNAVEALLGMVERGLKVTIRPGERAIAVTALGNTEPAAVMATKLLGSAGYQVIAFHASGAGGSAMEELIEEGVFHGVLDLTPHELTEEVAGAGAYMPIRPGRLKSAGKKGIPQVVSTGGLEYLCFGPKDSIPFGLRRRKTYMHNPLNANVKASRRELAEVGRVMAARLNQAKGPAAVMVPLRGWSVYGGPGGPFYDPAGIGALIRSLKKNLRKGIAVEEVDANINDGPFVETCVDRLLRFFRGES